MHLILFSYSSIGQKTIYIICVWCPVATFWATVHLSDALSSPFPFVTFLKCTLVIIGETMSRCILENNKKKCLHFHLIHWATPCAAQCHKRRIELHWTWLIVVLLLNKHGYVMCKHTFQSILKCACALELHLQNFAHKRLICMAP